MDRLARQGHVAVPLDPGVLRPGQDLAHGAPDHLRAGEARQPLEGGIDVQEPVIAGRPGVVADEFVQGEAGGHLGEQAEPRAVAPSSGELQPQQKAREHEAGAPRGPAGRPGEQRRPEEDRQERQRRR